MQTRQALADVEAMTARQFRLCPAGGVYFVKSGQFIKIGVATNVVRRVRLAASSWNPHEIEPLGWIHEPDEDDAFTLERKLHVRFAEHRHRGEWFHAHPLLLDFISTSARPWPKAVSL